MLGWHYAHLLVKTSHVTWNSPSEWFISAREHYCKGHHCTFSWPRVHFVWILLLLLCLITNSFTCLVQSKPVKQVVSCTVMVFSQWWVFSVSALAPVLKSTTEMTKTNPCQSLESLSGNFFNQQIDDATSWSKWELRKSFLQNWNETASSWDGHGAPKYNLSKFDRTQSG